MNSIETLPAASSATGAGVAAGAARPAINSDFETFLKMLTVQLQNQDPTNPMEASDFAVQLATFAGVEQQVQTNMLLQSLSARLGATGLSQLGTWVGMEVRGPAPARYEGSPVALIVGPAPMADRAELVARDENGVVVSRQPLASGTKTVLWEGRNSAGDPLGHGLYHFAVEAFSGEAMIESSTPERYARVTEAQIASDGGTMLVLEGGATLAASDVRALRGPG